jgi:hypothetical protein
VKLGAGIFWCLVVILFGGSAYFGFHVVRMMEARSTGAPDNVEAAAQETRP